MTTSRWAALGALLGAVAGVVWQAPAAWLAYGINTISQQRVQLRHPQGTLWQGSAQWVLSSGAGSQDALALPQRLSWKLQPQADASLHLALSLPCCTPQPLQLTLRPAWTGLRLELANASSQWPLAWLSGLGAPWNTLGLEGQAHVHTQSLALQWQSSGALQLQGQAQLQLQSVSSRLSTLRPLGSYALQLQGGQTARVQLSTQSGELHLSGQGEWRTLGLHFEGQGQAGTGSEAALANLLGVLGQRQGNTTVLRWG